MLVKHLPHRQQALHPRHRRLDQTHLAPIGGHRGTHRQRLAPHQIAVRVVRRIGFGHTFERRRPPIAHLRANSSVGISQRLRQPVAPMIHKCAVAGQALALQPHHPHAHDEIGPAQTPEPGRRQRIGIRWLPHHMQMGVQRGLVLGKAHIAVDAKDLGLVRLASQTGNILGQQIGKEPGRGRNLILVPGLVRLEPRLGVVLLQLGKKGQSLIHHLLKSIRHSCLPRP
mmetsp:Transcript_23535/g.41571  ORF Transcript_23535/g.41571 Transcript_23535/m.41571 type:complete len:227 (-) Transcript_23535:19-699(-)